VDRYECLRQITPERFVENLRVLWDRLDSRIPLVILNRAEVANEQEPNAHVRHALMNAALERFVAESGDCYMVDVRKHVCSAGDVTDNPALHGPGGLRRRRRHRRDNHPCPGRPNLSKHLID
jgi:hypothetical protein